MRLVNVIKHPPLKKKKKKQEKEAKKIKAYRKYVQMKTSIKVIPIEKSWLHFNDEPRIQKRKQVTKAHMTKGSFIEIQSNLRKNKIHRTNHSSNFLRGSFMNRDNVQAPTQLEEKVNPSILKDDFSSRADPSHQ